MRGTAAAASGVLTVMRTSSEPARHSSATCLVVEATSAVSVLVIDCTTTGALPPTCTPPIVTAGCCGAAAGRSVSRRREAGSGRSSGHGAQVAPRLTCRALLPRARDPRACRCATVARRARARYACPMNDDASHVLTPSQLNTLARDLLEGSLPAGLGRGRAGQRLAPLVRAPVFHAQGRARAGALRACSSPRAPG